MAKKSDDNLENFFLNRVGNYNIDYREEDWYKLNEMLDASEAMKAAAFKQKLVWGGSGALLVISIVLLLWMSQNLTNRKDEDTGVIKETEVTENTNDENKLNELNLQPLPEERNNTPFEIIDPVKNNMDEINKAPVSEFEDSNKVEAIRNHSSEAVRPLTPQKNDIGRPQNNLIQKEQFIEAESIDEIPKHPVDEINISNNAPEEIVVSEKESDSYKTNNLNFRAAGFNPALKSTNTLTIPDNFVLSSMEMKIKKRYSWNLSLAADYSAVGMSDFDGPSIRAGLSLEYYLSSRLSILSGVNYSVKSYSALGREYTPPYGFWTNGVVPNQTLGECNVLDIPLNLTYYIPNSKGQAFFIRSGLSSWLMLKEHYYYDYDSYDPDLVKYWGGENENYHFFGIVNFSAGFEHPINFKYSVLAEPYLNVPLGGVGFGEVNLYSAGMKVIFKINQYKLSEIK